MTDKSLMTETNHLTSIVGDERMYAVATPSGTPTDAYTTPNDIMTAVIMNWAPATETWFYVSASSFAVVGDQTAKYTKGLRLKFTQTTVKYGVVASSAYGGGNTTVTIIVNTSYPLVNAAISATYVSNAPMPAGFPGFFSYAPSQSGVTNGTFSAKFYTIGTIIFYSIVFTLGAAPASVVSGDIVFGLPVAYVIGPAPAAQLVDTASASYKGGGTYLTATTVAVRVGKVDATYLTELACDATTPHTWAATDVLRIAGYYEY